MSRKLPPGAATTLASSPLFGLKPKPKVIKRVKPEKITFVTGAGKSRPAHPRSCPTGHERSKKIVAKHYQEPFERRKETRTNRAKAVAISKEPSRPKSKQKSRAGKQIGVVTFDRDKWTLTLDFRNLGIRHLKLHTVDGVVEVKGLCRTHKNVWKNVEENYTIPPGYPCVVHDDKNGVWTVVARDCKGKCAWHRDVVSKGYRWSWIE